MPARPAVVWICLTVAATAPAPPAAAQDLRTAEDSAAGERLFRTNCAWCHGVRAVGGRGPNLAAGRFRYAVNDSAFLAIITDGIDGTPMWGAAQLRAPNERLQIMAYVRSLSRSARQEPLPGDSAAGAGLFAGAGGCAACHTVGRTGGSLGPDLSAIGWLRGPDALRESLLEPDAIVHPEWFQIRVVTSDGQGFEGRRLGEDTYTVRLLDSNNVPRGFRRSDLREAAVTRRSIMPGVAQTLTPHQIDDLVAYLASLRGGP